MLTTGAHSTRFRLSYIPLVTVLTLALVLGGCASSPPNDSGRNDNPNAGRYSMEHDSPILENFDMSQVRTVVPRREPRTAAGNTSPYTINGRTYHVLNTEEGYVESGSASWYGRKFHGHKTANGETYDMFQLSAAHRTLPLPSFARVTNLDNGRSVVVRVNDRGPFHSDRIIDLSYAAATMLDYAGAGTARVRVEAIVPGAATAVAQPAEVNTLQRQSLSDGGSAAGAVMDGRHLQVGAFSSRELAEGLLPRLSTITSLPAYIRSEPSIAGDQILHRVRIGPINDGIDVGDLIRNIESAGLGTPFLVDQ